MSHTQPNTRAAARKCAEASFKGREAQKADMPKATVAYYAAQQAAIDRISALRAQRLARIEKAPLKRMRARP
jgi:hypothetical protein